MKRLFIMILVVAACLNGSAVTIYVDQANVGGPWFGTQADPFQTITNALDALAASNAASVGGHTVRVADGVYTELVYLNSNYHGGTPANPNMLMGSGYDTVIDGESTLSYCMHIHLATNFIIKGFRLTAATSSGIRLNNNNTGGQTENWKIDSCLIDHNYFGISANRHYITGTVITNSVFCLNAASAIYLQSTSDAEINQCVFLFNGHGQAGGAYGALKRQYGGARVWVRNSMFAGNSGHANVSENALITLTSCMFYDNGGAIYDTLGVTGLIFSVESLDNTIYGTNNLYADPRFADVAGMDFGKVYEGSPCIGAGTDGANIGLTTLTAVPVSSNTYYVNDATGSDAYTQLQARDPSTPWKTIQAAVSRSTAGDTLVIAAGTYSESITITNSGCGEYPLSLVADGDVIVDGGTFGIHLYGATGVNLNNIEIISCSEAGIKIQESYGCNLRYLDVHAGADWGGAVYPKTGRNHLYHCRFHDNTYGYVGHQYSGGQSYEGCDFFDNNTAGASLGYHNTVHRFYNCNFYNNTSIGYRQSQTTVACFLRNCNFVGNGTYGVDTWYAPLPFCENCNVVSNGIYGAYENTGGQSYFTNCNFQANETALLYDRATTSEITTIGALNALAQNSDNIAVDPEFRDSAAGDFRLKPTSSCVDAGTTVTDLSVDYYGQERLVGPAVDIGDYEVPPAGSVFMFD